MMIKRIGMVAIAIACAAFATQSGFAMGTKNSTGESKAIALQESYVWYDGDRKQTIWLNPDLVAEFNGPAEASAVKKAAPGAKEVPGRHGAVRIWRIEGGAAKAIATVRAAPGANKVSPVFHDGPGAGGRMRAAPGNIIVYLNPAWNQGMVEQWAARNKLEIVKKLEIGPNIYVIKTGPGLEALQKANALRESGEVVNAFPDWWQETATR